MWEWQDATWHRLNSKDAKILEKAYLQDPSGCWPLTLGPHESCYQVDFFAMKQRSRNGRVRNLRRKEVAEIHVEPPEVVEAPAQAIPDVLQADMGPPQEILPAELLLPPVQDWSQKEAMEALGQAEALVEACQAPVISEEVVPPEAWQVPSDFGSLQSLQRSVALGRVVLVKGSWLALAFEPFSLGLADLPTRATLPPEAIWTQMDSLDEASAAERLVVLSAEAAAQESAGSLSRQLGRANRFFGDGDVKSKEERGVFLDCCTLYLDHSEEQISQWRDTCEWLSSPFTTKWLLSDGDSVSGVDSGVSGRRCWERHLASLQRSGRGVFQVEFNTELVPLLTTPQVTPEALESLLEEKSFQRPEDLEIAKALYREAFHRMARSLEVMDCSGLDWDDFHMLQLAEVLIHCKSLVKLILAENRLGDFGLEALASRLPETLEILDFSGNCLGDEGLKHLARHLPPRLRQLCLSSNNFGEPGLGALVETLPDCLQLSSLRLARVPLAGASLSRLVGLKALRHLCLNEAHLGCEGVLHLTLPTSLEELLLDGNSLGDAGLRMLTPKLPSSLQLLSLSDNGLRDAGLRALAPSTRSLRTLRVNSNHFTTQALQELGLSSPETKILAMNQRP
ncbi:unnamed protein product [Cladocopium goreaui]|uniref:Protein NLRC5 n=2 Tax=Cladocopium goreaui TaxID=2562237 RepID=A0A9P1GTL7_9DINO|nr:unnamed protein product [Cladocopium goreaui]